MTTAQNKRRFFAACNSADGFASFFGENLRKRADRSLIVKGGPGTGKSRLMHDVADAASASGAEAEYYHCSSDPDSLDGIFLTFPGGGTLAVIDGTSPHAEDVIVPGAADDMADLGMFWDKKQLASSKREIEALMREKKNAFRRAELCLAAAGNAERAAHALLMPCLRTEKIDAAARELVSACGISRSEERRTPLSAISMKGIVTFDTFRNTADNVIGIRDSSGCGAEYIFIGAAAALCGGMCDCLPLLPERTRGLLCGSTAIVCGTENTCTFCADTADFINARGFSSVRTEYIGLKKIAVTSIGYALNELREASRAHFRLEEIYSSAMDFGKKEEFSAALCADILNPDLYLR